MVVQTPSSAAERAHSAWFRSRLRQPVLTRPVSRGVRRVTAVGRLAETAVDGPRRAGDMYQNPAARLWLIEDAGMYKPTVLRTGKPGTTEVVAFLS